MALLIDSADGTVGQPRLVNGETLTAVVSIGTNDQVYYAWLDEDPEDPVVCSYMLVLSNHIECKMPKVDALYIYNEYYEEYQYVMAITYMYYDTVDNETGWDIGISIVSWPVSSFPTERDQRSYSFPCGGYAPYLDENPDISFDPVTGDLYDVWTYYGNPTVLDWPHQLRYRHLTRDWDYPYEWNNPGAVWGWKLYGDTKKHNGYCPRIDVGKASIGGTTDDYVAVAYTSKGLEGSTLYYAAFDYWATDTEDGANPGGDHATTLIAPGCSSFNSGFPFLEFAPYTKADNWAAVVYMQEDSLGSDFFRVYETDTKTNDFHRIQVDTEDYPYGVMPTIAIHYSSTNYASINVFTNKSPSGAPDFDDYWIYSVRFVVSNGSTDNERSDGTVGIHGGFDFSTPFSMWSSACSGILDTSGTYPDLYLGYCTFLAPDEDNEVRASLGDNASG
jgi:hypothetical protein